MKLLSALIFAALGTSVMLPAMAEDSASTRHVTKQATKKTHPKKTEKAEPAAKSDAADGDEDDDKTPDISASTATEYFCELGNTVTTYRNAGDDSHVALRWKKQVLRLRRVTTTTGANRFENRRSGWIWIDIPAKGILLDAKRGQQLANECRNQDQLAKAGENK
jgi:hypothetical protein